MKAQNMDYIALRKHLGDPIIAGVGVEIGAGLRPIVHEHIEKLYFLDKRNPEEFEQYFGAPPPYELISIAEINELYPRGLDFVTGHHVLEHIDNPIAVIMLWISLLKDGGVIYISIPSINNTTERNRLITPMRHLLEDYFFSRDASSYDSKSHIASFVLAMANASPDVGPWYGQGTVQEFAAYLLYDTNRRDDHDLHWHTFTLDVIMETIEISAFLSERGARCLVNKESDDSLYVAYRIEGRPGIVPEPLLKFREDIVRVANRLNLLTAIKCC